MSPREQKIAMRSRVNERLAVMSDQERSLASMDLCARLADCTHELDGFIFAFIPMAMEVDIDEIAPWANFPLARCSALLAWVASPRVRAFLLEVGRLRLEIRHTRHM